MVGLKSVSIYYFASLAILSGAQPGLYSFYMMLTVLQFYVVQGDSALVTILLQKILLWPFHGSPILSFFNPSHKNFCKYFLFLWDILVLALQFISYGFLAQFGRISREQDGEYKMLNKTEKLFSTKHFKLLQTRIVALWFRSLQFVRILPSTLNRQGHPSCRIMLYEIQHTAALTKESQI